MSRHPALLIISHDVIGPRMAGPGIRYLQLARVLAEHIAVTLAAPGEIPAGVAPAGVQAVAYTPGEWADLAPHVAHADVCLFQGDIATAFAGPLSQVTCALVIDGYDPVLAEWLAIHAHLPLDDLRTAWLARFHQQHAQFRLGDFFICASERQRDWWLGLLEAHGRVNPAVHRQDATLRGLVDVVPYGMPDALPVPTRPVFKGVHPAIAPGDALVLWGGGLWPWLDPLCAIRAVHRLVPTYPHLRLVFPGTKHPNPSMAEMPALVTAARQLAAALGLLGTHVIFGDWVDYADWPNVLLESDVALTLHQNSIETHLAFRSRTLETIWAGLPVVAAAGDATADLVAAYGVGRVVPPGDDAAVAEAIAALLEAPPSPDAFTRARAERTWARAAEPLLAFCRAPRRAPDRGEWLPTPPAEVRLAQLESDLAAARTLIHRYEQGRFMRAMRGLDWLRRRLFML